MPTFSEARAPGPAAFRALLQEARRAHGLPPDDEALAAYLTTGGLGGHPPPLGLRRWLGGLAAALRADAALHARACRLERRLAAHAATVDPSAHFRCLRHQHRR